MIMMIRKFSLVTIVVSAVCIVQPTLAQSDADRIRALEQQLQEQAAVLKSMQSVKKGSDP